VEKKSLKVILEMTKTVGIVLLIPVFTGLLPQSIDPLAQVTQQITHEIMTRGDAYSNLKELIEIGPRVSGSEKAEAAVKWAQKKMHSYGFDRVWLQPVQVPRWSRGIVERATLLSSSSSTPLSVAALGNSVGTEAEGVTAQVVEVKSLKEVQRLGSSLKGKIVFYNRPMDSSLVDTFEAYSGAVDQRTSGPSVAASVGAVAVLIRSLTTLPDDDYPHTGVLSYKAGIPKIPAAALSTHSANRLSQAIQENPSLKLKLELSAQRLAPVTSYNVIAEMTGSVYPTEYVVVGGHLDSWDLGVGAHDNGTGVVQTLETLRSFKSLGLRPKRTVRAVLFMSEEFGGVGGEEYARQAQIKKEKHIAALESDRGGFSPVGFSSSAPESVMERVRSWSKYLAPIHADRMIPGESGVDVEPLNKLGTVTFGFVPESFHYFDYHHSARDQFEAVFQKELLEGATAMAIFTYLLADQGVVSVSF
jgi:hypothetical protein